MARKRDPLDFALWKGHKSGEDTSWESPWGPGRPGWHIECSAMAEKLLGVGFEIHGGGSDLIFPHHENEAAQTRAAHDRDLTRLWTHIGMVRLDSEKMSKSIGNVFMLGEALERHGPETLLMYFVGAHYHQPMEYDEDRLEEARARAAGIRNTARGLVDGPSPDWSAPLKERFFDALAHDFNVPRALVSVFDWVSEANRAEAGTVGSLSAGVNAIVDALGGKILGAALPSVDSAYDGVEDSASLTQRLTTVEQRAAGRDHVLEDHHGRAGGELRALDPLAGAVPFGLLAHGEPPGPRQQRHPVGQGVGAHGRAADRVERRRHHIDDRLAGQAQRVAPGDGVLAVDVVVAPPTRGQLEGLLPALVAVGPDQLGQRRDVAKGDKSGRIHRAMLPEDPAVRRPGGAVLKVIVWTQRNAS